MFVLNISTTRGDIFEGEVTYLKVPGTLGSMGILTGHAPIISSLEPGEILFEKQGGDRVVLISSGGIMEMRNNKAVILADACERPEEIDVDRAKEAERRAKERLEKARKDSSIDVARAEAALSRAINRIRHAGRGENG